MPKKVICPNQQTKITQLKFIANQIRKAVIGTITGAGSGHPAGALGIADILAVLYFNILGQDDKFLLSNGHTCSALYAALAYKGEISPEELASFRKLNSRLQGHPHNVVLQQVHIYNGLFLSYSYVG